MSQNVVILGASNKPERTSFRAFHLLKEKGHTVFPVHPSLVDLEGEKVFHSLTEIKEKIDTVTVYLSPENFLLVLKDVIALNPKRVIFNPGSETLSDTSLEKKGIKTIQACTLVMLTTGQFD